MAKKKHFKALSVFDLMDVLFGKSKPGFIRGEELKPFICHGEEYRIPTSWKKGTEVECPFIPCKKVTVL